MEELKKYYDAVYVERFERRQLARRIGRLVRYFELSNSYSVIDFACGNAMLLSLIGARVGSYTGIDFSEPFIEAARKGTMRRGFTNADFHCGDIIDFCRAHPACYDAGFALDVSEHVYDEEWLRLLAAMRSSLRPGAKFYLHTPNAQFIVERMKSRAFLLRQFPEHVAVRSPSANRALVENAGFSVDAVHLLPHYNALRILHPFSFLPCIGGCLKARVFIIASAC